MTTADDAVLLVDLDDESRRALEFDALLAWVAEYTRTPSGERLVRSLCPSADPATVRLELESVAEVRRCLVEQGPLLTGRLPETAASAAAVEVDGAQPDSKGLRDLAVVLHATGELRSRMRALAADIYPHLARESAGLADLRDVCRPILSGMDPEGLLLDAASPELHRLRARVSRAGARLRRLLQGYLKDPDSRASIRDDFVTQRNGRYVIPVRSDAPHPIRGIVHASSSSGLTRFVEPLESVEPNNELVRLIEAEREEQQRILARWAATLRERVEEVRAALHGLSRVDGLQARALFAEHCDACSPNVRPGGPLRLDQMRHPLLQRRLAAEGGACVPASLTLDPADRVLVVSGPNTGGKTVALKTVGLSVLMAQSGVPISAREAELPLYRQVRVDGYPSVFMVLEGLGPKDVRRCLQRKQVRAALGEVPAFDDVDLATSFSIVGRCSWIYR